MSDIMERLRNWRSVHLARLHLLMEEAADEMERLRNGAAESREAVSRPAILADYREWRSKQEDRIGTHSDRCHLWPRHERCMIHRLAAELERLSASGDCPVPENAANEDKVLLQQNMTTLTAAERDVLREVCRVYADEDDVDCNEISYVLDRLLERLGGAANSTPIHRKACGKSRTGSDGETAGEDAAKCTVQSEKCPERGRIAGKSEPVAWVAFSTDGSESRYVSAIQEQAMSVSDDYNWCIAPLFAGLTDEEREAVAWAVAAARDSEHPAEDTLRGLLERTKVRCEK